MPDRPHSTQSQVGSPLSANSSTTAAILKILLVTLQGHFTGASIKPGDVQTIVDQINTDVNAINNFNSQAQQSMAQFDALTNK